MGQQLLQHKYSVLNAVFVVHGEFVLSLPLETTSSRVVCERGDEILVEKYMEGWTEDLHVGQSLSSFSLHNRDRLRRQVSQA
jgi:hypothetical protein